MTNEKVKQYSVEDDEQIISMNMKIEAKFRRMAQEAAKAQNKSVTALMRELIGREHAKLRKTRNDS